MNDTFAQIVLTAMFAAISALWVRLTGIQRRLEEAITQEANCQAKLETMRLSLEAKHEENKQAIASLYCQREHE